MPPRAKPKISKLSDSELFAKLTDSDPSDLEDFAEPTTMVRLFKLILVNQESSRKTLDSTLANLTSKTNHNTHKINDLESKFNDLDQYSRKPTAILTGLSMQDGESRDMLVGRVLDVLNGSLMFPGSANKLCYKDFAAIHRNGLTGRGGRPPSITLKFLRYYEKDALFSRQAKGNIKKLGCNIFHALCPGYIKEQNKIKEHSSVKFVNYDGPGRNFSVCMHSGKFINRVVSNNDFLSKLNEHDCDE